MTDEFLESADSLERFDDHTYKRPTVSQQAFETRSLQFQTNPTTMGLKTPTFDDCRIPAAVSLTEKMIPPSRDWTPSPRCCCRSSFPDRHDASRCFAINLNGNSCVWRSLEEYLKSSMEENIHFPIRRNENQDLKNDTVRGKLQWLWVKYFTTRY